VASECPIEVRMLREVRVGMQDRALGSSGARVISFMGEGVRTLEVGKLDGP
jgi:hypothetical protein